MNMAYFEADGRSLLGSSHLAPRLRTSGTAVLLCNPFGEEAARAHRAYRVLATRLQEAGYAAMRFDYSGTGDSSGDASEGSLVHWLDDIEAAAAQLQRQSGSPRITLVGLRFGATLAALCAQRGRLRLAHLVLWDPVVQGQAYLRELAAMHRAYMREELGAERWHDPAGSDQTAAFPSEALGVPVSALLAAEIAAIDIAEPPPRTPHVTVVCTRNSPESERLRSHWAPCPALGWIDVVEGTSWNSDAALNSALVPAKEIAAIVSRIRGCSP